MHNTAGHIESTKRQRPSTQSYTIVLPMVTAYRNARHIR